MVDDSNVDTWDDKDEKDENDDRWLYPNPPPPNPVE